MIEKKTLRSFVLFIIVSCVMFGLTLIYQGYVLVEKAYENKSKGREGSCEILSFEKTQESCCLIKGKTVAGEHYCSHPAFYYQLTVLEMGEWCGHDDLKSSTNVCHEESHPPERGKLIDCWTKCDGTYHPSAPHSKYAPGVILYFIGVILIASQIPIAFFYLYKEVTIFEHDNGWDDSDGGGRDPFFAKTPQGYIPPSRSRSKDMFSGGALSNRRLEAIQLDNDAYFKRDGPELFI